MANQKELMTTNMIEPVRFIYTISVVQLSGNNYFWVMKRGRKVIASSRLISDQTTVEREAKDIADTFDIPLFVEKRFRCKDVTYRGSEE